MKTEHFIVSTLNFFRVFFHEKLFFPKLELLNSGCGLSASAAYLRVFTVFIYRKTTNKQNKAKTGKKERKVLSGTS